MEPEIILKKFKAKPAPKFAEGPEIRQTVANIFRENQLFATKQAEEAAAMLEFEQCLHDSQEFEK